MTGRSRRVARFLGTLFLSGTFAAVAGIAGLEDATASSPVVEKDCEEVFEEIRESLEKEKEAQRRVEIVQQFYKAPCKETVEYLDRLYREEENTGVLMTATLVLGRIGSREAVQAIVLRGAPKLAGDVFAADILAEALSDELEPEAEQWFLRQGRRRPELRKNKSLWRQILVAMGGFKSEDRVPVLLEELQREKDPELQITILGSLEEAKDRRIARAALAFTRSPDPELQVAALRCLLEQDAKAYRKHFVAGLQNPHWKVRLLCLKILDRLEERNLVSYATKLLDDEALAVQLTAVRLLLEHGGKEVVPPLIERMKTAEGRLLDDLTDALGRLSGRNLGHAAVQWESWWEQVRNEPGDLKMLTPEEFSLLLEETRKEERTLTYHGLRVLSERNIFIIDTSESMALEYVPKDERKEEEPAPGSTVASARERARARVAAVSPEKRSRMEIAKEELRKVIKGLPGGRDFTIISFDSVIRDFVKDGLGRLEDHLATMNDETRAKALAFIEARSPAGQTYMLKALESALAYPNVETIYLLSDGAPTGKSGNTEEILRYLRQENRLRNVRVNTIGFHLQEKEKRFLLQLAEENFGVFIEK